MMEKEVMKKNLITRRESLKRIGGILAGIALGTASLPALTSCTGAKKRLVFFFSATGNSLYVARQAGGELLSIPQVMQGGQWEFEADEIGLVYPVYYFSLPRNVEEFLGKVKLTADYMFCIQTYSRGIGDVTDYLQHHAQKNNIRFDYVRTLRMRTNFLPYFDVSSEESLAYDKNLPEDLQEIITDIRAHKHWIEPVELPEERRRKEYTSPQILDR